MRQLKLINNASHNLKSYIYLYTLLLSKTEESFMYCFSNIVILYIFNWYSHHHVYHWYDNICMKICISGISEIFNFIGKSVFAWSQCRVWHFHTSSQRIYMSAATKMDSIFIQIMALTIHSTLTYVRQFVH